MTVPFTYPAAPHRRQHGPRGYADYESYRAWLRDEFSFRCVYCLTREAWGPFLGLYAIDHFVPVAIRPDLLLKYDNLLYACAACNLSKADQRVPDPTEVLVAASVEVAADGTLHSDIRAARRLIDLLRLNRGRLRDYRKLWIGIIRLTAATDPDLYRQLMGFPEDLPNLSRLRPPGGNTRPQGIRTSLDAQRKAGSLPATY